MTPLVNFHGGKDSSHTDNNVQQDPENHLGDLGLGEEFEAKLDDEDELTEADHDEDPALGSHPLALGVRDIGVILSGGGAGNQTK